MPPIHKRCERYEGHHTGQAANSICGTAESKAKGKQRADVGDGLNGDAVLGTGRATGGKGKKEGVNDGDGMNGDAPARSSQAGMVNKIKDKDLRLRNMHGSDKAEGSSNASRLQKRSGSGKKPEGDVLMPLRKLMRKPPESDGHKSSENDSLATGEPAIEPIASEPAVGTDTDASSDDDLEGLRTQLEDETALRKELEHQIAEKDQELKDLDQELSNTRNQQLAAINAGAAAETDGYKKIHEDLLQLIDQAERHIAVLRRQLSASRAREEKLTAELRDAKEEIKRLRREAKQGKAIEPNDDEEDKRQADKRKKGTGGTSKSRNSELEAITRVDPRSKNGQSRILSRRPVPRWAVFPLK